MSSSSDGVCSNSNTDDDEDEADRLVNDDDVDVNGEDDDDDDDVRMVAASFLYALNSPFSSPSHPQRFDAAPQRLR